MAFAALCPEENAFFGSAAIERVDNQVVFFEEEEDGC